MGLLIGFVALPLIYYSKFLIDFSCFSLFTGILILQEEIHELLLSFAEVGATVVRLKGGDRSAGKFFTCFFLLVLWYHESHWLKKVVGYINFRSTTLILLISHEMFIEYRKLSILQNKFLLYVLTDM